MKYKWLTQIMHSDTAFFNQIVDHLIDVAKEYPSGWTRQKIFQQLKEQSYDCLLGFEKNKLACWWAVNKDPDEKVLKGFMVYTAPEFRKRGYALRLTAELVKRARKMGFNFAQLGLGTGTMAEIHRKMQERKTDLGVSSFNFNHETGRVDFPSKPVRKPATNKRL